LWDVRTGNRIVLFDSSAGNAVWGTFWTLRSGPSIV
jgi:hypothetical protein